MSSIEALKEKARRHEQKEEWHKARDLYRQAIARLDEDDQPDIGLRNRLGDLETRLGNLDQAMKAYDQAVELYMEAELPNNATAVCKKILRNMPDRTEVFLRMGQIRASQGFLVDARQNFLTYAERMQAEGDIDEAFRALIEFADSAPEDAEIRVAIAGQMEQHDRIDDALAQLARARAIHLEKGEEEEAESVREKMRELDPEADPEAILEATAPEVAVEGPAAGPAPDAWADHQALDLSDERAPEEDAGVPETDEGVAEEDRSGAMEGLEQHAPTEEGEMGVVTGPMEGLESTHLDTTFERGPDVEEEEPDEETAEAEADLEGEPEGETDEAWTGTWAGAETSEPGEIEVESEPEWATGDTPAEAELDEEEIPEDASPLPLLGMDDVEQEPATEGGSGEEPWEEAEAETEIHREEALEEAAAELRDAEEEAAPELPLIGDEPSGESRATEDESWLEADTEVEEEPVPPELEEEPTSAELPEVGEERSAAELLEEGRLAADEGREDASQLLAGAADVFEEEGDVDGALAAAHALVDHEPDEVEHRQRLVELAFKTDDSDFLETAYLGLAACMERAGKDAQARAVYQQVLTLDPGNETARAALDAAPGDAEPAGEVASSEEYVDLGSLILDDDSQKTTRFVVAYEEPSGDEQADFAKMLSQFKQKVAENLDVDDVKAHHDLGTAYKEMGLLDEAIEEFQAAIRASGGHLPTYELLGQCFMEKGEPEATIRTLTRALERPHAVEDELLAIYYTLGRAHEALGNTSSAVEFYDRVFALDINFGDVTERLRALR
jgi:tetratricopeptide (TPR) repeat protein